MIIFTYSWIYDEMIKKGMFKKAKGFDKYPTRKEILNYIKKIEKLWEKDEKKILKELSRITGLKWKTSYIFCYIVGRTVPFSRPLTMPVYNKYPDYFIDVLVHELIHNLFVQNEKENKKVWKYFSTKYKRETQKVKIHVPIHAIHKHIYLKFFNEKRLQRNINLMSDLKDYKRAWDIVERDGYKNIIKEFRKRVK